MVQEFIDQRRGVKRLKKLDTVDENNLLLKRTIKTGSRGNVYQHTNTGYRSDLGIVFRSGWEANVARVLKIHGIPFEFEPHPFSFPVKRGTKTYIPDFYLPKTKEYIEVKGFFDEKSRIKLKRFKKYYPDRFAKLTLVISRGSSLSQKTAAQLDVPIVLYYEDFRDTYKKLIPNQWEGR